MVRIETQVDARAGLQALARAGQDLPLEVAPAHAAVEAVAEEDRLDHLAFEAGGARRLAQGLHVLGPDGENGAGALRDPLPPAAWGESSVDGVLKGYLPNVLGAMMEGGKLYGVPDQMNAHSLYINNRLFREAGLDPAKDAPKTWEDVVKLNKALTKQKADRIVQKGWEMRYAAEHWLAQMFQILLYQVGGEMTRDGKPTSVRRFPR